MKSENVEILNAMIIEAEDLLNKDYDWDHIDYIQPEHGDIKVAKDTITEFVNAIDDAGYILKMPYISCFEEGGASFKWGTQDERTMYIEIGRREQIVTKLWDEDEKHYIKEYELENEDYVELWKWANKQ